MLTVGIFANSYRLQLLQALVDAYRQKSYHVIVVDAELPEPEAIQRLAQVVDAILVVGPGARAPGTVLSGPVVQVNELKAIPIGWIPHLSDESLLRFSFTAASLHQRSKLPKNAIAILSQWLPRYLRLADRIEDILTESNYDTFRWTSDVVFREDMLRGLGTGLAAAFYVGHGRPNGLVGYHGLRAQHFDAQEHQPIGALFCLCCRTASRKRTAVSFSEKLLAQGVVGAVLASTTDTLHLNNTRWAINLIQGLQANLNTVGELVAQSLPINDRAIADYRIIGDPLAPLCSSHDAAERAQRIPIYA